tara:strand:+ start:884 stop:1078 length:195 start_codon:yes stop_codon:yes gene_type:complete
MAKYKATPEFEKLENKFFGVHKIKSLLNGNEIEITAPNKIPADVMSCLEEQGAEKTKKTKKKGN